MTKQKLLLSFCAVLYCCLAVAQPQSVPQTENVEMAELFFKEGKVYVVVVVASMVFVGMAFYMFLIDRKLSRLEKKTENKD